MTPEQHFREILVALDVVEQEVLDNTPGRYVSMLDEMLGNKDESWEFTTFESKSDELVLIDGISFHSLCEHHVLPFVGVAHIAYIPQGRLAGLSKFARCVQTFARGLWVQEDLTAAIANELEEKLEPKGVAVVLRAEHTCMTIRGAKSPGARTTTSAMRGVFLDNDNLARSEFLGLIR